jgi:2,4-dienoyl-CoA reductase-like NADH-dependent reductase (Old Yellow Enzyme family)
LYQVPFSEYIKKEVDIATGAEGILQHNQADYILIARELLKESDRVNRASKKLQAEAKWPKQYLHAKREKY